MAISSQVQLYNLALNAIGDRSNISSPTEVSRQAEVCDLWYTVVRDQILAAAPWPEATKMDYLALLSEVDDDDAWVATEPRPGYSYVYSMPSDALRPRYMSDFSSFLISHYGDNKRAVHSNTPQAILAYTQRLETISLWDPELQMAMVYGLAAHICMPLSGKPARAKMLADKANELILNARIGAANVSAEQHEAVPDWIAARGYSFPTTQHYIYPHGPLLTLTNVN